MVFLALAFKVIISDLILIGWVLNWHAKLVEWLFKTCAMIEKSLAELNPSPCPGWPSFLMDLPDSSKTVLYLRPLWGRPGGIRVWLSVIEGWCGFDPWMIDLGFDHSLQPIISNPIRVIDLFFFFGHGCGVRRHHSRAIAGKKDIEAGGFRLRGREALLRGEALAPSNSISVPSLSQCSTFTLLWFSIFFRSIFTWPGFQ